MRSLIAFVGIFWCASVAAAADGDAATYWPSAAAPAKPKVVEYPSAAASVLRHAVAELPPPQQAAAPADPAPDPPQEKPATATPLPLPNDFNGTAVRLTALQEPAREATKPQAADAMAPVAPPQSPSSTALALGGHGDKSAAGKASPLGAAFTVGGSLSIVLGLFLLIAWAMRKTAPRGSLVLPREVFEILGRAPLGARQQVQLLRCGCKLLLVSITPNGTETLTEVTDPMEVDRIAGICQQSNPKSSTAAFRQVFQQIAAKPSEPAEIAGLELSGLRRKRYRWEEKHA